MCFHCTKLYMKMHVEQVKIADLKCWTTSSFHFLFCISSGLQVTGIVGRADILACIFFLISLLIYHGYVNVQFNDWNCWLRQYNYGIKIYVLNMFIIDWLIWMESLNLSRNLRHIYVAILIHLLFEPFKLSLAKLFAFSSMYCYRSLLLTIHNINGYPFVYENRILNILQEIVRFRQCFNVA